jgi:hypothetical protein
LDKAVHVDFQVCGHTNYQELRRPGLTGAARVLMGRLPVHYHAESDRETRNLDQYNCHEPCQMPLGRLLQDGDESNHVNNEETQKGNPEFWLPKVLFELYANTPNQEARPVA